MGRTEMGQEESRRVGVLPRMRHQQLRMVDASRADARELRRIWAAGECRDAAAVDAGSGIAEPGTETAEALTKA